MNKEELKVSDVVNAQIIGKDNDNKEREEPATEATDSDADTRNSKNGVVGGAIRADNPA